RGRKRDNRCMDISRLLLAAALALPCSDAMAQDAAPVTEDPVPPGAGSGAGVEEAIAADAAAARTELASPTVGLEDVRRFVAVFRAVQQAYVDPVEESALMNAAVRGLLTDLDPHSSYLQEKAASALSEQASGAYDGL